MLLLLSRRLRRGEVGLLKRSDSALCVVDFFFRCFRPIRLARSVEEFWRRLNPYSSVKNMFHVLLAVKVDHVT